MAERSYHIGEVRGSIPFRAYQEAQAFAHVREAAAAGFIWLALTLFLGLAFEEISACQARGRAVVLRATPIPPGATAGAPLP